MNEVLDWLGTKSKDPLDDLIPLRHHLRTVLATDLQSRVLLRLLDLFEPRIVRLHTLLFPLLLDTPRPLPRNLRILAQSLVDLHGLLAEGVIKVVDRAPGADRQRSPRRQDALAERALQSLQRQYELALRNGSGAPAGFWRQMNRLIICHPPSDANSASRATLKLLLAMHAAQPEALTPHEQDFLWRHTAGVADRVELTMHAPQKGEAWLWMDIYDERAPTPANRRAPPIADGLFFYHCHALGTLAQKSLDDFSAPPEWRSTLHYAARRWLNPPSRRHARRRGSYRVEICPRLSTLWALLNGDLDTQAAAYAVNEWQILNDSPAGYAVMHIAGDMPGLLAGSVIGIRRHAKAPWSLCIVRWSRSENPEHLEMGLEVLAPHAEAVRIAIPSRPDAPLPALLLPPVSGINRGEALLTERGAYESGSLALLQEDGDKLQVVECRPRPLITQTASIELFEFERVQHSG